MIDDVYNRKILELAADIPHLGRLATPQASATTHSRLCGSTVTVDLVLSGDVVAEFAQEVKACALGQASASILGRAVVGARIEDLRAARDGLRAMLKDGAAPPEGRFAEVKFLEPVRDYKARHASTLLAFDAVCQAIDTIEAGRRDRSA
ncbi:iron-sulfur cluster assembly scaffold protein [Siculibacillus lacustris]|uniref:Iron-sulfur cluster assembly scaffold protein n=1 Tax=Siculibacillus lacustris TaxID=1549641 RepID=A0A4Q9VFH5_9HYPH|nr:iron-sulfur cluster assembly scaffold protein [Siculibacillus lacustris]TBW33082.1 iron-sulfur cluster assembly scaffold protein [Siculibacillus lacustris]